MTPEPLTQDAVLAQLRTRGFEEGFQRTPLRDFWGVLSSITGEMREGDRGAYMVALYNHENVEVIESTEPYTSPIGQFEIAASSRARSGMGYMGRSIDKIINAGIPEDAPQEKAKNQDFLLGKRCHWKLTPGHMIWSQRDGEERPRDCWELMEVEGIAAAPTPVAPAAPVVVGPAPVVAPVVAPPPAPAVASVAQQALSLLDGRTEQQWHQVVLTDSVVKTDMAFIQTIISREFLKAQEEAGIVTKDADGTYHLAVT